MKKPLSYFLVILFFLVLGNAYSGDWNQWRGPDRTDISDESGLLKKWPAKGPKLLWTFTEGGLGYAGVSTSDGKLFTMGARKGKSVLICIDIKKGKELWDLELGSIYQNGWGNGPRSTPTVDGKYVYAMNSNGDLTCASVAKGKKVWKRSMQEFGGSIPKWGYAESVFVDEDQVIATPGGSQGAMVALDKKTGKLKWQCKGFTDGAQYSSVIKVDHYGEDQYIQLTMKTLAGVDCKTGKLLWKTAWPGKTAVIPTPIYKDGFVYITSGYGSGCKLVKISKKNKVENVYSSKDMTNHHGGVILLDGYVYGYADRKGWVCQDFKTGTLKWQEKAREHGKGAIAYADGHFYCYCEKDGTLVLIDASPKGWKERGRFKLPRYSKQRKPRGKIWMHPVISNGKLYLRDQEFIFCFDVKGKK
jgi:outer membrane protein assembly factor BamB